MKFCVSSSTNQSGQLCDRHDFGSHIYAKTGNLKAVMAVMGHKDVKTAVRYQHPDLESVRAALNDRRAAPVGA